MLTIATALQLARLWIAMATPFRLHAVALFACSALFAQSGIYNPLVVKQAGATIGSATSLNLNSPLTVNLSGGVANLGVTGTTAVETGTTAPTSGCSTSANLGSLYEQTGSSQIFWRCSTNGSAYLWVQTSVPWADVQTAGAKGDGSTDDTAVINSVLAANTYVFFPTPSVCYKITGTLQMQSYQYILGASRVRGICSSSTTADALYASTTTSGTRYIRIENMYIQDSVRGTRTAGAGIHIDGGTSAAIFDLQDDYIYGFYDGVNLTTSITSKLDGVRSDSALRDAFHSQLSSTSTNFINTYGDAPGRYCYYADDLSYSSFNGTACDSATSDAYHFESGDGGYPTGISFNGAGAESVGANGMNLDGIGFTINGGAISGMPTGTGMAAIKLNGAGAVSINMARLRGGDYAVNLAAVPGHGTSANSVQVTSTGGFYGQGVGFFNDPNNLLAVDMTQVPVPASSGLTCSAYTFALDTSYYYACNAASGRWYRGAVTIY